MKNNWTREELIIAFNLYCKLPFTKINSRNPKVIELSSIIGRSPSAVAMKLANYARLDPSLRGRHVAGMRHGSKGEEIIWREFYGNWEQLAYESELLLSQIRKEPIEVTSKIDIESIPHEGKERETLVRQRVNQNFFRSVILASYNNRCCITGLSITDLLIASHIIPWSKDAKNRLNPHNGICLNALHDKAFDSGLITITTDYKIKLSSALTKHEKKEAIETFFLPFHGKSIQLPQRFLPEKTFLKFHNDNIFNKQI